MACDAHVKQATVTQTMARAGVTAQQTKAVWSMVFSHLPRCKCGAFVSPRTGVCKRQGCGLFGQEQDDLIVPWPPTGIAFTTRSDRVGQGVTDEDALGRVVWRSPPAPVRDPDAFRSFADGDDVAHWQVSEDAFITDQWRIKGEQLENTRKYWEAKLEEGYFGAESMIERCEAHLAEHEEGISAIEKVRLRRQYVDLVKDAIGKDEPVPQAVVDQYPEFQKARTARERYRKALHTSFGNRSVGVDDSMQSERGWKVKRQDGKPITGEQKAEIARGMDEIEQVLGPLDDVLGEVDLTIAHTNGKHPFLSKAGGLYSVEERTISTGVKSKLTQDPFPSLAHEIAHCLDYEAGNALDIGVRITLKGHRKYSRITAMSEYDTRQHEGCADLIDQARWKIVDAYEIRRLSKRGWARTDEQKQRAEVVKVALSAYWREPREIWARLVEQYVATQLARSDQDPVSVRRDYAGAMGYWSAEDWAELEPMVEKEIKQRLGLLRGGAAKAKQSVQFGVERTVFARGGRGRCKTFTARLGYGREAPKVEVEQKKQGSDTWVIAQKYFDRDQRQYVEQVLAEGSIDEVKGMAEQILTSATRYEHGRLYFD